MTENKPYDPDDNLIRLRALLGNEAGIDSSDSWQLVAVLRDAYYLFYELDKSLANGGKLPGEWGYARLPSVRVSPTKCPSCGVLYSDKGPCWPMNPSIPNIKRYCGTRKWFVNELGNEEPYEQR